MRRMRTLMTFGIISFLTWLLVTSATEAVAPKPFKQMLQTSREARTKYKKIGDYQRGEWRADLYSSLSKNKDLRKEVAKSFRKEGARPRHIQALAPLMPVVGDGGARAVFEHPFNENWVVKYFDDRKQVSDPVIFARGRREDFMEQMLVDRNVPVARTIIRFNGEHIGWSVHQRAKGVRFLDWLTETGISDAELSFRQAFVMRVRASVRAHDDEIAPTMRRIYRRKLIPNTGDVAAGNALLDLHNGNFVINPKTLEWMLVDF